jgi:hypothetical protein
MGNQEMVMNVEMLRRWQDYVGIARCHFKTALRN